jgi:hypothetical protein
MATFFLNQYTVLSLIKSTRSETNWIWYNEVFYWLKTRPIAEERQLDLSLLVDQYQQILLSLTAKPEVSLATLIEGISLLTPTLQVNKGTVPDCQARGLPRHPHRGDLPPHSHPSGK